MLFFTSYYFQSLFITFYIYFTFWKVLFWFFSVFKNFFSITFLYIFFTFWYFKFIFLYSSITFLYSSYSSTSRKSKFTFYLVLSYLFIVMLIFIQVEYLLSLCLFPISFLRFLGNIVIKSFILFKNSFLLNLGLFLFHIVLCNN